MKRFNLNYKLFVLTVFVLFVWAVAADMPFTFKAGDVISAEQMNQNFAALNNGKQELVKGICAAGSSIRAVAPDGSVTCEVDDIGSGSNSGVDAINSMTGAITLQAGDNITIDDSQPGQIRISSSSGSSYSADGTSLALSGITFSIKDGGVSTVKLANSSVTASKLLMPMSLTSNPANIGLQVSLGNAPSAPFVAALVGRVEGKRIGVHGISVDDSGVYGTTVNGNGVWGESQNSTGVYGLATTGAGVWGDSTSGVGVRGRSTSNNGVYGESTSNDAVVGISKSSSHAGIVSVNTTGFAAYFEAGTAVCSFKAGTTNWACASDRNLKENFEAVNPKQVLESVAAMPVTTWNLKGSSVRQIGPTAQDFYAAFNLGDSDKTINNTDAQGVALVAIQGLYQLVQEQQVKIEELESQLASLQGH